jgi:hypothetical protein
MKRLRICLIPVVALMAGALSFVGAPQAAAEPTAAQADQYIRSVAPFAQEAERQFGVPSAVSLAQSILESGWGHSALTRYGQAYFGIKCTQKTSEFQSGCVSMKTQEHYGGAGPVTITDGFRTYPSALNSFLDHGRLFVVNSRYHGAFDVKSSSVAFARAIAKAGYATDPQYADKLIRLMRKYDLYSYDLDMPGCTDYGAIEIGGAIGEKYAELGGATSPLGAPIGWASEGFIDGSLFQSFNNGAIMWTKETGAHAIYGEFWHRWRESPGLRESLGFPTSDPEQADNEVSQRFQRGQLTSSTTTVGG